MTIVEEIQPDVSRALARQALRHAIRELERDDFDLGHVQMWLDEAAIYSRGAVLDNPPT